MCDAFKRSSSERVQHESRPCIIALTPEEVDFIDAHMSSTIFGPLYVGGIGTCLYEGKWYRCLRLKLPSQGQQALDAVVADYESYLRACEWLADVAK
jgi:hypothetical protein